MQVELVAWYRANRSMLDRVLADPDPGAVAADDPFTRRMSALFERLRTPWRATRRDAPVLDAVLAHALAYATWRSLARAGLDDERIVELLVGWVVAAASEVRNPTPGVLASDGGSKVRRRAR
jgi:hypothetical protein